MSLSVLFTGYAPVHFLCFRPLYDRLRTLPQVELFVSGGLRSSTPTGYAYDGAALYKPFGIPEHRILPVEALQQRSFDVLFSASKRIIAPPENLGARIQIFHGVSFRNRGVRPENLTYDFLFVIGPYMRRKFIETGILPENDPRAVPVGFPKTDPLLDGTLNRQALLRGFGFGGRRAVLLYAPTGEACNSLETIGEEVIGRLAGDGRYDLLVKPHDHPKNVDIDWYARLAPFESAHTRVVRERDVIPLLACADLLITDASSVANEFTLLNRPIVFLDVPELLRRSREGGAQLDLQTWGRRGGITVEQPEKVEAAVADSLALPECGSDIRAATACDLFYNPGRATNVAFAWFSEQFLKRRAQRTARVGARKIPPAAADIRPTGSPHVKRPTGAPKKIAFYLRDCGNLHYFAALKPYLDHYLRHRSHDNRIVVRALAPRYEEIPEYAGYTALFTTDCELDGYDLVLTPSFLREHERCARAVQIFHGMSDKMFTYERDFSAYRLCLCVGQRQIDRLRSYPQNRGVNLAMVGYPKFDTVPTAPKLFANEKKTLIYCPTWRKGGLSSVQRFLDDTDSVAHIASRYNLIVKPHPNLFNPERPHYDPSLIERLQRLRGIRLIRSGNVMPWFAQADLFIGDVSASGYEWLYFQRPMLFLNPQPGLLRLSEDVNALTYLWQCGDVCADMREVIAAIESNLHDDRYSETRESVLHYSVFKPRDGRATRRGLARIKTILDTDHSSILETLPAGDVESLQSIQAAP